MGDPMRTNKDSEKAPVKRRDFLKLAGLGGVAAGAAVAGAPRTAVAAAPDGARRAAGYRATAHVRKYYDSSRF